MKNLSAIKSSDTIFLLNEVEYSVSDISLLLKKRIENEFGNVRIRGEISGYNGPHSSGHAYFSLKDSRSRLEAVIWKGTMQRLQYRPEEGMEIVAFGKLTTYPGSSKYQIVIENLEPAGTGALMALLEERKLRLQSEGLFNPERKKKLPLMPKIIGVITSPTGAVIRDIVHRIQDRFPLHLLIWPVRVQGNTAKDEIIRAIQGFNKDKALTFFPKPDLLIIARGGGSIEDLWVFNDEDLVRAVAQSELPIISAVGHETDWTLTDLAADVRAPTPTAAAEMATPVKAALEISFASLCSRFKGAISRYCYNKSVAFKLVASHFPTTETFFAMPRRQMDEIESHFKKVIESKIQKKALRLHSIRLIPTILELLLIERKGRVKTCAARIKSAISVTLRNKKSHYDHRTKTLPCDLLRRYQTLLKKNLNELFQRKKNSMKLKMEKMHYNLLHGERLLKSLSYRSILSRGFVLVSKEGGEILKQASTISPHTHLTLTFSDGSLSVISLDKKETTK